MQASQPMPSPVCHSIHTCCDISKEKTYFLCHRSNLHCLQINNSGSQSSVLTCIKLHGWQQVQLQDCIFFFHQSNSWMRKLPTLYLSVTGRDTWLPSKGAPESCPQTLRSLAVSWGDWIWNYSCGFSDSPTTLSTPSLLDYLHSFLYSRSDTCQSS